MMLGGEGIIKLLTICNRTLGHHFNETGAALLNLTWCLSQERVLINGQMHFEGSIIPRSTLHQSTVAVFSVFILNVVCEKWIDGWLPAKLVVLRPFYILLWCRKISDLDFKLHRFFSLHRRSNHGAALITQVQTLKKTHRLLDVVDLLLPPIVSILRTRNIIFWTLAWT